MRTGLMAVIAVLWLPAVVAGQSPPRTWRLDYFHTGTASDERFSVDRVVVEPLAWAGNRLQPLDSTNLGKYFAEVIDRATNRVIYSRGFASVYGEWETTGEARRVSRTFHESVRFPEPSAPVQVVIKKRDPEHAFREVWSTTIDPADLFIDRAARAPAAPLLKLAEHGDPSTKVDLLLLGDGYTAAEAGPCESSLRRLAGLLFEVSPFKDRRSDFNVWGLCPPAAESGVSRPSTGIHRRSPAGATYDAFGSERYVLSFENKAFRELASWAPYDAVTIVVNGRTYGGGGIFGLYSTVAADSVWAKYLFVHEFAHHFAALADEYYTSDAVYLPAADRIEPWEPNVTALLDPSTLKWRDLVAAGTPVPTPWSKEAFEQQSREIQARRRAIRAANRPEEEMDALFLEQQRAETTLLGSDDHARAVGAFEGANYEARGSYRPQIDCIMFSRNEVPFCAVCRRTIERVIDMYTGRGAS